MADTTAMTCSNCEIGGEKERAHRIGRVFLQIGIWLIFLLVVAVFLIGYRKERKLAAEKEKEVEDSADVEKLNEEN